MGKSLETTKGSVWALFLTAHAVLVEEIEVRLADADLPPLKKVAGNMNCVP